MINKRGQLFAIILVFLTLFMCFVAAGLYYVQVKKVDNSIASPIPLLVLEDKRGLFELQEKNMMLVAAEYAGEGGWGSSGFINIFRDEFLNYLVEGEQKQFRDFLFENLTIDGNPTKISESNQEDFFANIIYPKNNFKFENGNLIVRRSKVGKKFKLEAYDKSVNNFVVDVDYEFEKEYLIKYENDKFFVEEA